MKPSTHTSLPDRFIRVSFYLLFALVPLLLTPLNYELFEYNKMMAVYILTAVIGTAWTVKSLSRKEFRVAVTPLDIPIAAFFVSQLISSVFSMDQHVSWFGYYSRFNGGMWSIISYFILYYAFLSNPDSFPVQAEETKKPALPQSVHIILRLALTTAAVVSAYGVLERLGIDKHIWVQDVQNRVFSTLGQPNWLAAYLVALVPLGWFFFIRLIETRYEHVHAKWWTAQIFGIGVLSALYFLTLLFTKSRSGLLGFAVADIAFWGGFFVLGLHRSHQHLPPSAQKKSHVLRDSPRNNPASGIVGKALGGAIYNQSVALKSALVLHIAFAVIIFATGTGNSTLDRWVTARGLRDRIASPQSQPVEPQEEQQPTGPALEVGGTSSRKIREYVWQGAVTAWRSSVKTMLIGTGTETFAFAFYRFRPAGHNMTSEWDFLYNKAHNEYLNFLATTGILGLGTYLIYIAVFIIWCVKILISQFTLLRQSDSAVNRELAALILALFAGWLSILVTNFFGFSVVISQVFLFLFPALAFAAAGAVNRDRMFRFEDPQTYLTILPVVIKTRFMRVSGTAALFAGILMTLRIVSLWYADTQYAKGYRLIRSGLVGQAIPSLTTAVALNYGEPVYRDERASAYATLAVAAFEGGNATQAAQLGSLAIEDNAAALAVAPENINFHKTKTKVYYTLSMINPEFTAKSVEALEQAIPLSPNDPKLYYNLAILLGRDNRSAEAIQKLQRARELKPNYRDAYYALWVFYTETKDTKNARTVLEDYLRSVDPSDAQFRELLDGAS